MKRIFCLMIIFLCWAVSLFAITANDKSGVITIDGQSSDFQSEQDQIILSPDLAGSFRESVNDSVWGQSDEVTGLAVTWDRVYLYIAVDGIINNNGLIVYIDSGSGNGVSDVSTLPNWKRKFKFLGMAPDFFIPVWDQNTTAQFWSIQNSGSDSDQTSSIQSASSFKGTLKGAMEVRIPWSVLYNRGTYQVKTNAVLKIVCAVVAGDNNSGPDSAPDNSQGMPVDSTIAAVLDNYVSIPLDQNGDGLPDIGVSVRAVSSIAINIAGLKYVPLEIKDVLVQAQQFSPNKDGIADKVSVQFTLTKDALLTAKAISLDGTKMIDLIDSVSLTSGGQTVSWDGNGKDGILMPSGLYIIQLVAQQAGVRSVKKIPVMLVR